MSKEAYLRDKELAAKADTDSTASDTAATATREKELEKELETVRRFNEQNRKTIAEAEEREADLKAQLGSKDEEIKRLKKQLEASKKTEAEAKKATTETPAKKSTPATGSEKEDMLAEIYRIVSEQANPEKGLFITDIREVYCLHISAEPESWIYIPDSDYADYAGVPMFKSKISKEPAEMKIYRNRAIPDEHIRWLSTEESVTYYLDAKRGLTIPK